MEQLPAAEDFRGLEQTIRDFGKLAKGWDSYEADPPSPAAVDSALAAVRELEAAAVLPEWLTPTADSSILMRHPFRGATLDWEFHPDGDVAVMRKPRLGEETFHDLDAVGIPEFFASLRALK